MRHLLPLGGLAALMLSALPAYAQDYPGGPIAGDGYRNEAQEAWLADCRQRLSAPDSGVGGAIIGGAVGGLAGNRLAGRGNRTAGTVAGAAVGAAAGALIDKAEDSGRDRDACAAYLDGYYARMVPPPGYPVPAYPGAYPAAAYPPNGYGPGYGYGYPAAGCCAAPAMMMVPVVQAAPHCTETVEYVYEDVPAPARRVAPRRSRVPDKRVKLVPDKRVPTR